MLDLKSIAIASVVPVAAIIFALFSNGLTLSYNREPPRDAELGAAIPPIHPGVYAFYDSDNLSPVEYPWLTGGVIVRRWNQISTGPGALDWSPLDRWIEREERVGKRVILRVSPHDGWWRGNNLDGTPDWVYSDGVPKVLLSTGAAYPEYWHSTYRQHMGEFIAALGAKYDGDPRIEAIEMGVGLYGEAFPGPDDPGWVRAGLSDEVWTAYVKEIIDDYASAFVQTPVIFMEQFYPQGNFHQMGITTDYAAQKGIHVGFNGLRAEDETAWSSGIWPNPGWHSPFSKWVMSGLRLGRFEAHHAFGDPALVYWAVLNALDSNATYLALYQVDVTNPANEQSFDFAQQYLGKTIYDTPGVWIALRGASKGLRDSKPHNYTFGLTQNDPGGTSVALWNVGGKEGHFARTTDQVSGKNDMSFKIDSRYLQQNIASVFEVSVTYLDKGTDTWELQYDSIDDPYKPAGIVTKTDSGQWKVVTFTLEDACLGGRQQGSADLRILSNSDGDDIFHMLKVTGLSGPVPELSGVSDGTGAE